MPKLALALLVAVVASTATASDPAAPPTAGRPSCQGFVLGEDRNEVAKRLTDARVPFTGNVPGARVFFVQGFLDAEASGGAEYQRLTFDEERLTAVETYWLAELSPDGRKRDPRFSKLLGDLTARLGRPKKSGTSDFEWYDGEVEIRLYERRLNYKEPGRLESFLVLRHGVRPKAKPSPR